MRTIIALILSLAVLFTSTLSFAADGGAGSIMADTLIVRPVGIVAIAVGTAVFIASLPFALISGSTENAARQLIVAPAKFTFTRPLGNFDPVEYYERPLPAAQPVRPPAAPAPAPQQPAAPPAAPQADAG
ncbi:MAG: hypothetical protein AB1805_14625 [Nitrospirota bacterium]